VVGGDWSRWTGDLPVTLAEGATALALALALGPEVTAHAAQPLAALDVLHLGVRLAEVTPLCTFPFATSFHIVERL